MEPIHRFVADGTGLRERRCGLEPARRLAVQAGLAALDLAGGWAGFAGAALLHGLSPANPTQALALLAPPLAVIVAMLAGAYDRRVIGRPVVSAGKGAGALVHATIAALALFFAVKLSEDLSRVATIGGFLLALCLIAMGRIGVALAVRRVSGGGVERCVLIEDGSRADGVAWARRVDALAQAIAPDADDPVMMGRIGEYARGMDRVIVACPPARRRGGAHGRAC